jgi:hypothetical protein
MINFRCPKCKKNYAVKSIHAGKKAKCKCGAVLQVPKSSESVCVTGPNYNKQNPVSEDPRNLQESSSMKESSSIGVKEEQTPIPGESPLVTESVWQLLEEAKDKVAKSVSGQENQEYVLLKIPHHPRKSSIPTKFFKGDEFWSILVTNHRILLVQERKSYFRLILGLLTGGIGAYFLEPVVDSVNTKGLRSSLEELPEVLCDEDLDAVKKSVCPTLELPLLRPVKIELIEEISISFILDDDHIAFREHQATWYEGKEMVPHETKLLMEFKCKKKKFIFDFLDSYRNQITSCIAMLLDRAQVINP